MPYSSGRKKTPHKSLSPPDTACLKASSGLPNTTMYHFDDEVYGGEMGEEERQNGSCTAVRGSPEKVRVVRYGLILASCLPPRFW